MHAKGDFFSSLTCLKSKTISANGYGYLYEDDKRDDEKYLQDFNRSGKVLPSAEVKFLPVTNHTFDVFNATGQGISAAFRPYRNDVLSVSESNSRTDMNGFGISGEVGIAA